MSIGCSVEPQDVMGKHKLSGDVLRSRIRGVVSDEEYNKLIEGKRNYNELGYIAHAKGLLNEYEAESTLPMDYTVVKTHLWTHITDERIRECIDKIVVTVSTMYSVGTRFLGGWVLENEQHFANEGFYEATLGDATFLKHAFRGVLDQGTLNMSILTSESFKVVSNMYPTIEELRNILPDLSAWNNLVGSIVNLYQESIKLHIRTHLWTRVLGHIKRFATANLHASIISKNRKQVLSYDDDKELPLKLLYDGIKDVTIRTTFNQEIQKEINHILSFFTETERSKLPFLPDTISGNMFRLHLYMRSKVPCEEALDNVDVAQMQETVSNGSINPSQIETVPDGLNIQVYSGRGWTPVPIARMGRVHITIDTSKVLPAIVKKFKLCVGLSLTELFGLDRTTLKKKRETIRKRIRKMSDTKKRQRARKSTRNGGLGLMHRMSADKLCKPRSVMTDGVSLCIRYGSIKKERTSDVSEISLSDFVQKTNARLISNDPGRVNIFQMTERSEHGFHHGRFTRAKYRVVGLSNRFQEDRAARKKTAPCVIEAEDLLCSVGGWKARTKEAYIKTLTTFNAYAEHLLEHYGQKVYTRQKMMSYRRKQSVLIQRFANFLDVNKKKVRKHHPSNQGIVLGIGNASFAPSGKGETAVPTTRVAKLFARYLKCRDIPHRIISLDEFRTTKCCNRCGNVLDDIRDKLTHRTIRGLKSCCHCGTKKTGPLLLNRDANAAINLLKVTEAVVGNQPRPEYLQRPKKESPVEASAK